MVKEAVAAPTTTAAVKAAPLTTTGVPTDLAEVLKASYVGGHVPSSPSAARVLPKRKAVNAAGPVVVKGAVASWKDIPIAVVTDGNDVEAGTNKLTRGQALVHGRARYEVPGGDLGRSANQGLLIIAATSHATQAGPASLPAILQMGAAKTLTNLSAEQVLTFAAGVHVTPPNKVHNGVAAGELGWTADRPADRSSRRQRPASVRRHQGWQPVVIVGVQDLVA